MSAAIDPTRGLSAAERDYLKRHPSIKCLQPQELPRQALYLTQRHGAVTLAAAMELDVLHDQFLARELDRSLARRQPLLDTYSVAEDRYIDLHGSSPQLS